MSFLKNLFAKLFSKKQTAPALPPKEVTPPPVVAVKPTPAPAPSPALSAVDWLDVALGITSKFEGKGFVALSGDFDGMGISAGVLQWNFGQGSLQAKLLKGYQLRKGDLDKHFPEPIAHLIPKSIKDDLNWVRSHMLINGSTKIKPEWAKAWTAFLVLPEVLELQKLACHNDELIARSICAGFKLKSLRSFCYFFDLVCQNGSLKGLPLPLSDRSEARRVISAMYTDRNVGGKETKLNKAIWEALLPKATDEQVSLLILAHRRALISRSQYYCDVLNRRGSIAMGEGWVHGTHYKYTQL